MTNHEPPSELGFVLMLVIAGLFFWLVIDSMSHQVVHEQPVKVVTT